MEFLDLLSLGDGTVSLELYRRAQNAEPHLPAYEFLVTLCPARTVVGKIALRIGMNEYAAYNGNLGYATLPDYRGRGYMPRACRLCALVAGRHGMRELTITTNIANESSKRVLEKIGACFHGIAELPPHHELYRDGKRRLCVYKWDISELSEEGTVWTYQT